MTVDLLDPALDDRAALDEPAVAGERTGRGGAPAAEPMFMVGESSADQAVFDAEFAAMMLTEGPWAAEEPSPATVPPRAATRARRAPPPRAPREHAEAGSDPTTATGMLTGARRRPGPGPRSPP